MYSRKKRVWHFRSKEMNRKVLIRYWIHLYTPLKNYSFYRLLIRFENTQKSWWLIYESIWLNNVFSTLLKRKDTLNYLGFYLSDLSQQVKYCCLEVLWEPYPSHHNGLFSPLLVLRDFAARGADQSRSEPLQLPGSTSAGRVICSTDLAECVSVPGDCVRPQGAFPPGFYPFGGLGSSPGAWGAPNKRNTDGAVGILGNAGRMWALGQRPDSPKKGLCHICPLGGIKYRISILVLSEQYETSCLFYVNLSCVI